MGGKTCNTVIELVLQQLMLQIKLHIFRSPFYRTFTHLTWRIKWRVIIAVIRNVYNCDDHPSFNSSLRSSHIWFSYILKFIIILSRVHNEPIQRPTPIWLVRLSGRALHRYHRGKGFESRTSLNFFQAFFSQLQKLRIELWWSSFI